MLKKLAAVLILCLLMASFELAQQGHRTAFASMLPLNKEAHADSLDSQIAISIIERVAENSGNVSFKATKTVIIWHRSGTDACISNIARKAPDLTRTEYLPSSALGYGPRTVISDGKSTWHYEPSLQVVFHMADASSKLHKDNDLAEGEGFNCARDMILIKSNYQISLVAIENMAGRQAYVIELEPRHPGNPSRRIWVDREYPFILKTEKYGHDGIMSSVSFYTQIEFFPLLSDDLFHLDIPPDVAKVELPASGRLMPLGELEKEANFPIPVPKFVPPGYVIEGGLLSAYEAFPAAHIRLTDGLNTISYFVLPGIARDSKGHNDLLTISDTSGAKVLRWSREGYEFTLVGEVDESLLAEMAKTVSVAPHAPGDPPQPSFSQYFTRLLYQLFWFER
jgi:outer membrane lipoprotein-sorting protein